MKIEFGKIEKKDQWYINISGESYGNTIKSCLSKNHVSDLYFRIGRLLSEWEQIDNPVEKKR